MIPKEETKKSQLPLSRLARQKRRGWPKAGVAIDSIIPYF